MSESPKNMKPVQRTDFEKAILRRRSLIETVFDQLKNLWQIEHTRHHSMANFIVNLGGAKSEDVLSLIRLAQITQFNLV